ncbi:unnamed protein product [Meloidogyne enterolobii]|uniref:Uncharacterized protein n=1 Tax=Meloidogyne enterolobii TaxID=390850 RepID=A0ACB0YVM8_MELEN
MLSIVSFSIFLIGIHMSLSNSCDEINAPRHSGSIDLFFASSTVLSIHCCIISRSNSSGFSGIFSIINFPVVFIILNLLL